MALQVIAPGNGAQANLSQFQMQIPKNENLQLADPIGKGMRGMVEAIGVYAEKKQKMRDSEDLAAAVTDLQRQAIEFQSNWKGTHFGVDARDAGKIFSGHVDQTAIKMIEERFGGRPELASAFRQRAAEISFSGFSNGTQYDDQQDLQYRKSVLDGQRNDLSAIIATGTPDDINRAMETYKASRGVFFPGMDFSDDDHKLSKMVHSGMIERSILDGNMQGARAHLKAGLEAGVFSIDEFSRLTSHIDQGVIDQISIAGASGDAYAVRRVAAENGFKGGSVSVSGDFSAGIARETTGFSGNTKYGFGSRDPNSGRVDCSGWVGHLMESTGLKGFKGKTADQLVVHAQKVGRPVGEDELFSSPSEGLVIGIDQGPRSYDKGRVNGIDHVVLTYKDPSTGRIMVSESSSSKGVHSMPLDEWLSYHKRQGHKFFAGQVGGGDANPDHPMNPHQAKVKAAADVQLKKIEANITQGSEDALKLGKYGDLSALRDIESNLRRQGFTEKANAYADQIKILASTENARKWAAVAPLPEVRARQRATAARVRDPFDFTDRYNTALTPDEEREFREWQKKNPRLGNTYDYDARGYWKELKAGTMKPAEGDDAHAGDKYKKPNHPTFSDQSIYHGADGFKGGHWEQRPDGSWIYTATESNTYGADRLGAYFSDVEKGNTLVPHPNQGRAAGKTLAEYQKIDAEAKALEEVLKSRQAAYDKDPAAAADSELVGVSHGGSLEDKVQARMNLQKANGVLEPAALTKAEVDAFGAAYENSTTPAAFIQQVNAQYGKQAPAVMAQLVKAKKIPQAVNLIADMDAAAGGVLARTSRGTWVKDTEAARGMKPVDRESIKGIISDEMEDILETIIGQGDPSTANAVVEGAYGMALYYMGQGMSEKDAARRASDEILKSRYTVRDGYRIPSRFDADQVGRGVQLAQSATSGSVDDLAIIVPRGTGLSSDQLRTRKEKIIRAGNWRTNSDETGLVLCVAEGIPVRRKDGRLVQYTFDELMKLGKED